MEVKGAYPPDGPIRKELSQYIMMRSNGVSAGQSLRRTMPISFFTPNGHVPP
jgi:hypothetical protein